MNDQGFFTKWTRLVLAAAMTIAVGAVLGGSTPAGAVDLGPANGFTTTRTAMELEDDPLAEGNKVVDNKYGAPSFDWNSILPEFGGGGRPPYLTPSAPGITSKQSLGVVDTSFGYDVADQSASLADQQLLACVGNDPSGLPGSQTVATYPFDIAPENNINNKGDLCSGGAAVEVIEENGQYRYVLYQYWTRQPITGGNSGEFNIFQILEGPEPGRCDDLAIWFDYSSSSQVVQNISVLEWTSADCFAGGGEAWASSSLDVNAYAGNTGKNADLDPARQPQPSDNFGSFGESAVDLTAAGVIPTDECATFTLAGFASSTSNNGNPNGQQLLDVFTYPQPIVIDTCSDVRIDKETEPAEPNPAADFDYAIQPPAGSGNPNSFSGTLTVPGDASDARSDIVASPAYVLVETGLDPIWTNTLVSCQAFDAVSRTWKAYSYVPQTDAAVPFPVAPAATLAGAPAPLPATDLIPAVNPGESAACKIVNEASGIVIAKAGLPAGSTVEFPFSIDGNAVDPLAIGESQFYTLATGSTVTITEGLPNPVPSPGFQLQDITCLDASGAQVGIRTGDSVSVTVGEVDNIITCTFTNVQQGRIIIDKQGLPADSGETFDFTISGPDGAAAPILVPVDDLTIPGPASSPITVQPGTYTVRELEPPFDGQWALVDIVCDNEVTDSQDLDAQTVQVAVGPGEVVNCVFTNNQRGTPQIEKTAVLVDPSPVDGTIDQFDVRYTITATNPSFVAEDIEVVDAFQFPTSLTVVSGPSVSGAAASATWDGVGDTTLYSGSIDAQGTLVWTVDVRVQLDLDAPADERDCNASGSGAWNHVDLFFEQVKVDQDDACVPFGDPDISVDKTVVGAVTVNADQTMSVTYQIDVDNVGEGPGVYELSDDFGFPVWVSVTDVAVTPPAGVTVDADFDGGTNQDITTGPVGLGAGATDTYSITVTFTAAPTATNAGVVCGQGPGDGLFNLASITSTSGPDTGDACIDIPRGRIVVTKATLGGTDTFGFDGVTLFPANTITTVADDGTPSDPISAWVTPGSYGLTETAPAGWTKIAEPCGDFVVADGQTATCDFVNGKQSAIIVEKYADPDGTFPFALGGDAAESADLATVAGFATVTWDGLDAGTYTVTESTPNGFFIDNAMCDQATYTNGGDLVLGWGSTITCVYTNEAFAEIVIEKQIDSVDPDAGTVEFAFTGDATNLAGFSLVGGGSQSSTAVLLAGTYTIDETVTAGWDLTGIECSTASLVGQPTASISTPDVGGASVVIDLEPGDRVTCTFTNTQRGEITVIKDVPADAAILAARDQAFDFSIDTLVPENVATFSLDDSDLTADPTDAETTEVLPGTYAVTESAATGWTLTGVVCDGVAIDPIDGSVATVVEPGESVECTFTNVPDPADVTIDKTVTDVADDYPWSFEFSISSDDAPIAPTPASQPAAGVGPDTVTIGWQGLIPGATYTITETEIENWTHTDLVCAGLQDLDQASNSVTFIATVGMELSCEITNTPVAPTLIIEKQTIGGVGTFDFSVAPATENGTSLVTVQTLTPDTFTPSGSYDLLTGASYSVDEINVPAEWAEGTLVCQGATSGTPATGTGAAAFSVDAGDDVVCRVTNSALGNITIIKNVIGADGVFTFNMSPAVEPITGADGNFTIDTSGADPDQVEFLNLQPGTYVVSETDPTATFDNTNLVCSGPDGSYEITDLEATITLGNGVSVFCTFTNTERGYVKVNKLTDPAGATDDFPFSMTGQPDFVLADGESFLSPPVPSGADYTVSEDLTADGVDPNWVLTSISCSDDQEIDTANSATGGSVTVNPGPGEVVECTFTNELRGPITVTKSDPTEVVYDSTAGEYSATYTVTVTSASQIAEVFDLVELPGFPASGVDLLSLVVTGPGLAGVDALSAGTPLLDDQPIDELGELDYQVVATFTIDGALPLADRACNGEPGSGAFNAVQVTNDISDSTDDGCIDLPDPDISVTKEAVTDPAQPVYVGGNVYTVAYDIVVTNAGDGPGSYTLTEAPDFGSNVTVTGMSATSADGTVAAGFSLGSPTLADGVELVTLDSHTYRVTVTFTIGGAATLADRTCDGPGTATYNQVNLTYNGVTGEPADDCVNLPTPTITVDKAVSDGQPVHVTGNVYTVEYTVTVDNVGEGPGAYDLVDTPDFGTGATITNVNVTGNGVSIDQASGDPVTIITGESIDPDEAPHVYTVTVTFEVAGTMTTEARTCASGEERAGFGAYNGAEITYNDGGSDQDDDCVDIPEPEVSIIKSLDAANPLVRNADGTWTIGYLLTVSNAVDAGPAEYDLDDSFDFPTGVTVDDVQVSIVGAAPAASVLVAGFDGDGQPAVAADVQINDGDTHVYRIVVDLTIEVVPGINGSCTNEGGLVNTMSVSVRGDEPLTDDACDSFSTLTLIKRVVNDDGGNSGVKAFTLTAAGPATISGTTPVSSAVPAGTYALSETQVDGYTTDGFVCGQSAPASSVTVPDGANVTCTIVNDDEPVDLKLTKDDGGFEAIAGGDPIPYTITVDNLGPRDVDAGEPATVTDTLPSYLSWVTPVPNGCSVSGKTLTCVIQPGRLEVSDPPVVFDLEVDVAPNAPSGNFVNRAWVDLEDDPVCQGPGCTPPPCPATSNNNVDCETTPIDRFATITIVKTDDVANGDFVQPGDTYQYTLSVTNNGPSTIVPGLTVDDDLPAQLEFVSATGNDWTCNDADPIQCVYGKTLGVGATAPTITVTVLVAESATGDFIENLAVATGYVETGCPEVPARLGEALGACDPITDEDDEVTPLQANADLAIVKTASVAQTGPNGAFDWVLDVTNNGPATAIDVVVGDIVPKSLTVGSVASSFFDCTRSGNAVECTRDSMAVGASGRITIAVTVNASAVSGSITNVGTVESSTPDPDLTNNSDDATVDVVIPLPPTTVESTLPRTGGGGATGGIVKSALLLILLGGAVVLITRRRRDEELTAG